MNRDALSGFDVVEEMVAAGPHRFQVLKPRTADDLISDDEYAVDERLPYWAELWPSGRVLADRLAQRTLSGLRVVELGAGLAIPSLVAAAGGASVVATDWYEPALAFVALNAQRLNLAVDTMFVDWRDPPQALLDRGPFDLVVAADVLYEPRNAAPLAALLPRLVADDGDVIIADPRRPDARSFLETLASTGWSIHTDEVAHESPLDEAGPIVHLHHIERLV
jgi:predicted nicotinamide N-methyase